MATPCHNMTNVFWSLVNYVCTMSYEMLCKTNVYAAFSKVARTDATFKLHLGILDDFDASMYYDALPTGVWTDGEWLVFGNMDRLFYGLREMYDRVPDCERKMKLNRAILVIEYIITLNEAIDLIGDVNVSEDENEVAETQSIEDLFAGLTV